MSRLSSSKLGLALNCVWWLLPSADDVGDNNAEMGAAIKGTSEHKYIEGTMRTADVTPKSTTHARWIDDWYTAHGEGRDWHVEFTMAMDPITSRVITGPAPPESGPRYPWCPPGFIPGTADAMCVVEGGASTGGRLAVVIDWKSGFRQKTHLSPARSNLQLWWLAIMAAEWCDADEVLVEAVYVQPDGVWRDWHVIDALELRHQRVRIANVQRVVEAGTDAEALAPKWGPWCKDQYCPKLGRCPVSSRAVLRLDPRIERTIMPRSVGDVRGPEHAAVLYMLWQAIRSGSNELIGILRGWQDENGPIGVRPGFAWGRRETRMEKLDGELTDGALEILRDELGEHWMKAVKVTGAKTRIYSAAREVAADRNRGLTARRDRVSIKSIEEAVLARLRLEGVLGTKIGTMVDEWPVTVVDQQNHPWLTLPPDGTKVLQRVEDEEPDDNGEDDG